MHRGTLGPKSQISNSFLSCHFHAQIHHGPKKDILEITWTDFTQNLSMGDDMRHVVNLMSIEVT